MLFNWIISIAVIILGLELLICQTTIVRQERQLKYLTNEIKKSKSEVSQEER